MAIIQFSKYAEQKFELLNKHKVYITREQVEEAIKTPEKLEKKGKYMTACRDSVKVIYKKEEEVIRVITFFPIKC